MQKAYPSIPVFLLFIWVKKLNATHKRVFSYAITSLPLTESIGYIAHPQWSVLLILARLRPAEKSGL